MEDAAGDADAPAPCPPSIDPDAEPGDIVSQFPLAGEKIDNGKAVDITIAVAAEIAPVPKVTGGAYEDAVASPEGAGLTVGRLVDQPSENEATALIRRQIPHSWRAEAARFAHRSRVRAQRGRWL